MHHSRFQRIYIEIINRCNLRCSFCPPENRPARIMSAQEFERITCQIGHLTDHICLHVKGEPLMHPELTDILTIAARRGLKVNLTTNAVLLGQQGHLLIGADAPRQVSLSLHSFDANTMHDLDFNSYLANAIAFAKIFTASTPGYISFRLWNLDGSISRDQHERNALILKTLEDAYHLDQTVTSYIGKVHGNAIAPRTFINFDQLFDWPSLLASDFGTHGTCYGLRRQLAILVDGTVVPCCLDSDGIINLGNIFSENINTILQKEKSLRIIEDFQKHNIREPLCRRCGYRTRF